MQCSQTRTIICRHYGAMLWVYLEMCWLSLPSVDLHSSSHTLWRSSLLFCLQTTVKSNLANYCGIFSLPQLAVMDWLARELHDASHWWFINGFIGLQHFIVHFCAGLHTVVTSGQEWRSPESWQASAAASYVIRSLMGVLTHLRALLVYSSMSLCWRLRILANVEYWRTFSTVANLNFVIRLLPSLCSRLITC